MSFFGFEFEQLIITILVAFVPSIVYAILIRYVEKYNREPWGNIFSVFLWGATMAIILMIILRGVFKVHFAEAYPKLASDSAYFLLLTACVVTPIIAEIIKPIGLFFVSGDIEESEDGLIYGAVAGLGFAATDSFLYGMFLAPLYGIRTFVSIIIIRSISVILIHACVTSITGYGFSRASAIKHKKGSMWAFPLFLLLAIAIHSAFNYLAITNPQLGTVSVGDVGAVSGSLVFSGGLAVIMMIFIYFKIYKLDRMDKETQKERRREAVPMYPEVPISAHGYDAEPPPVYPARQQQPPPRRRAVAYPPARDAYGGAAYTPSAAPPRRSYMQEPPPRRRAAPPPPRRRRAPPPPSRRRAAPPPPRRRKAPPPPPRKKAPPPPPPIEEPLAPEPKKPKKQPPKKPKGKPKKPPKEKEEKVSVDWGEAKEQEEDEEEVEELSGTDIDWE